MRPDPTIAMTCAALLATAAAACGSVSQDPGDDVADDAGDDAGDDDAPAGALIHLTGRFSDAGELAWPGSAIGTRFSGTTLSIELEAAGGGQYFDFDVDGEVSTIQLATGRQTYVVAEGLADDRHDVRITRRTESFFGLSRFHGFSGGELIETPAPERMIEFIGDSITCGYGVLGTVSGCEFGPDTEAETHAWGALAADQLDAAHAAIAYSGIGMYRNYAGDPSDPMPVRYGRIDADDPGSIWNFLYVPDVIVIALGTNDFSIGDPGQPFIDAYVAFVQMLRGRFDDAVILLATSPMLSGTNRGILGEYLGEVVATVGDPHVSVVEIPEQLASDGYGCDFHPSEATQAKMAVALVPAIRAATGW